jgi:hypothetical protein
MKNWKTTSTGITMIVAGIVGFYFAYKNGQLNEGSVMGSLGSITGGIGLLAAKDFNVTGGTTVNVPNDASVVKDSAKQDQ